MKSDKPIKTLIEDFLQSADINENSQRKYRSILELFLKWAAQYVEDIRSIQKSDIIRYKKFLIFNKKSAQTIDLYLTPIKQFFKYLEDAGIYTNITTGIHSAKRYRGFRKDYLTPEQAIRLLNSIDRRKITGMRDYAIINLMLHTGMRCVEIFRADVCDIKRNGKNWLINVQGKGRIDKDQVIGVTWNIVSPIYDYLNYRGVQEEREPLFTTHAYVSYYYARQKAGFNDDLKIDLPRITPIELSRMIKRRLRKIGIDDKRITAHSLRHTAAITALKNGASLLEVQSMLRHSEPNTTMIYQRAIEQERSINGGAVRKIEKLYKELKISKNL
ncbi:MAG: tyrosine-type recombinase/integrase [Bacteroidales bacterium]|nr:tyrosine-type recombinase/integrase [Bacteroidales bacterium]